MSAESARERDAVEMTNETSKPMYAVRVEFMVDGQVDHFIEGSFDHVPEPGEVVMDRDGSSWVIQTVRFNRTSPSSTYIARCERFES
jgi:hypothetical protein